MIHSSSLNHAPYVALKNAFGERKRDPYHSIRELPSVCHLSSGLEELRRRSKL